MKSFIRMCRQQAPEGPLRPPLDLTMFDDEQEVEQGRTAGEEVTLVVDAVNPRIAIASEVNPMLGTSWIPDTLQACFTDLEIQVLSLKNRCASYLHG